MGEWPAVDLKTKIVYWLYFNFKKRVSCIEILNHCVVYLKLTECYISIIPWLKRTKLYEVYRIIIIKQAPAYSASRLRNRASSTFYNIPCPEFIILLTFMLLSSYSFCSIICVCTLSGVLLCFGKEMARHGCVGMSVFSALGQGSWQTLLNGDWLQLPWL